MDVLDKIVADWRACSFGEGACAAARLHDVLRRAHERATDESFTVEARNDALGLFSVQGGGLPPFLRLLRCDGRPESEENVLFLRFWQAFHELWGRLREAGDIDDEPLADEIFEFMYRLIRRWDSGGATRAWAAGEIAAAWQVSADQDAWVSIVERFAHEGEAEGEELLEFREASSSVLAWLREVADDYCRGPRCAAIRCVSDVVVGCRRRDACLHLGRHHWEIEDALRELCGSGRRPARRRDAAAVTAWSTYGSRLRKVEVECPICAVAYDEAGMPPAETRCCFQVTCTACRGKLTDSSGLFTCPFCRTPYQGPPPPPQPVWAAVCAAGRFAGGIAGVAGGVAAGAGGVAAALLEVDRPRRRTRLLSPHEPVSDPFDGELFD